MQWYLQCFQIYIPVEGDDTYQEQMVEDDKILGYQAQKFELAFSPPPR